MPLFKYKAMDDIGKIHKGRMHGNNVFEIEQRLSDQKYDLINCNQISSSKGLKIFKQALTREELINFVFQLQQLTKAGVPLIESLHDLRDSAPNGYYRDVLGSLSEDIEGGKTFSQALEAHPNDFDHVFVSLITVGEESGTLSRVLNDMGETMRWIDELIAQTKKIMIYPSIVGTIILAVSIFLMVWLVPQIIPVIEDMGGEIPGQTQALIATSDFFANYWPLLITLPFIIFFSIKFLTKRSDRIRLWVDKFKLVIPIFGNLSLKIKLARLVSYTALLYSSGITIIRSLEIGKELVNNSVLYNAIEEAKMHITDGNSISKSFEKTNIFPTLVVRMIKIGESTGNLEESLLNVSYFYNREVKETVATIEPAIGPILTVVMGVLLGWIMLSVLGPVWDTVGGISQ